jgi:pyruvate/2-oxoglutarate dehydrogenase complex dihydrolipoamide acyltransferase (E2) component
MTPTDKITYAAVSLLSVASALALAPTLRDIIASRKQARALTEHAAEARAKINATRSDALPHHKFHAPALAVIDEAALLWAIAERESGNNHAAIGNLGELGRCQFMPKTWAKLMPGVPHRLAANAETAAIAEHKYYSEIITTLNKRGMAVTVPNIADSWHRGEWHNEAKQVSKYAQAVANLYEDRVETLAKGGKL